MAYFTNLGWPLSKGRTINDLGGLGQKREKKLNGYSPRKIKTQLNNPEEKKKFNG